MIRHCKCIRMAGTDNFYCILIILLFILMNICIHSRTLSATTISVRKFKTRPRFPYQKHPDTNALKSKQTNKQTKKEKLFLPFFLLKNLTKHFSISFLFFILYFSRIYAFLKLFLFS